LAEKSSGRLIRLEPTHAIAEVVEEAKIAKKEGKPKTILFNLCGHGHFGMRAYGAYLASKATNHYLTEEELKANLRELEMLAINL